MLIAHGNLQVLSETLENEGSLKLEEIPSYTIIPLHSEAINKISYICTENPVDPNIANNQLIKIISPQIPQVFANFSTSGLSQTETISLTFAPENTLILSPLNPPGLNLKPNIVEQSLQPTDLSLPRTLKVDNFQVENVQLNNFQMENLQVANLQIENVQVDPSSQLNLQQNLEQPLEEPCTKVNPTDSSAELNLNQTQESSTNQLNLQQKIMQLGLQETIEQMTASAENLNFDEELSFQSENNKEEDPFEWNMNVTAALGTESWPELPTKDFLTSEQSLVEPEPYSVDLLSLYDNAEPETQQVDTANEKESGKRRLNILEKITADAEICSCVDCKCNNGTNCHSCENVKSEKSLKDDLDLQTVMNLLRRLKNGCSCKRDSGECDSCCIMICLKTLKDCREAFKSCCNDTNVGCCKSSLANNGRITCL